MNAHFTIHMSPYLRISQVGFNIDLKSTGDGRYKLLLKRQDEIVAVTMVARTSNTTVAVSLRKVQQNHFGATSAMYAAMQSLADIAEALASNKSV